ncbi:MAG TPA: MauE/DoxX family redox-associated membrane protein [Gemmatimonadaceae bacterium]|nr:MauE/DoxX family redox-associated membrane protein [Gemmatimonadaceae bacterium]
MTRRIPARTAVRGFLALLFLASGILHLAMPAPYRRIVPAYFPAPALLVAVSGWAEIIGAIGLLVPRTRGLAAWGLMLLLVAVFPANVEMLRLYREAGASWWSESLLWLRLPLQLLLILAVWRVSRAERPDSSASA